ncbi:MAG: DNA repair protein [Pseudomonadota bacterium]
MYATSIHALRLVVTLLQYSAMALIVALACLGTIASALAAFGIWPWLGLSLSWGETALQGAGMWSQLGLTALAIALCVYLPANARILRLEAGHRRFDLGVADITRAYHAAHAADRSGTFQIAGAFEETRDRLTFLRDHPDLERLEPEMLEVAAQMSFVSRDLAEAYSDARVARARDVLTQRQHEIDRMEARLAEATAIHDEFAVWTKRLELEENVARAKLAELVDNMARLMPELADEPPAQPRPTRGATITALPRRDALEAGEAQI